jgi:hypothetical protein
MTQEDKELLLKYLCAILPYGVIVRHADYLIDSDGNYTGQFWYKRGYLYNICRMDNMTTTIIESEGSDEEGYEHICDLERSLPYLRPMSSMTEEELKEFRACHCVYDLHPDFQPMMCNLSNLTNMFNWLLSNHFDLLGLIAKGLAIEVTEENNPYE